MIKFGIEEEFCIVSADTYDIRNAVFSILKNIPEEYKETNIKSDLHECILEVSSSIHTDLDDCYGELMKFRTELMEVVSSLGFELISAGVHPYNPSSSAKLISNPRYERLTSMGGLLAEGVHFGMHLHIGIVGFEERMRVLNIMRYFIPELVAMTVNSPCYKGEFTGFQSTRLHRYDPTPTVGIPVIVECQEDFKRYINDMAVYGIEEPRDIYWDIRVRPSLDTLEFRVMDSQIDVPTTIATASFILSLFSFIREIDGVEDIEKLITIPNEEELKLNREKAKREGLDGKFIIGGEEIMIIDRILNLMNIIKTRPYDEWLDRLRERIIEGLTGASQQNLLSNPREIAVMLSDNFLNRI